MSTCSLLWVYIALLLLVVSLWTIDASEPAGPSWIKQSQEKAVKRQTSHRRLASINFEDSEYYSASDSSGSLNFTEVPNILNPVLVSPENGNFSTVAGIFVEAQGSSNADVSAIYIYYAINEPLSIKSKYILREGIITLGTTGVTTLEIVALYNDPEDGLYRSDIQTYTYYIESSARPGSYGYLAPYWNGYFTKVCAITFAS